METIRAHEHNFRPFDVKFCVVSLLCGSEVESLSKRDNVFFTDFHLKTGIFTETILAFLKQITINKDIVRVKWYQRTSLRNN